MAQQRNLDDPATFMEFAQTVKTENLDSLMLLISLTPGQAPPCYWKEILVWQWFHQTYLLSPTESRIPSKPARAGKPARFRRENLSPLTAEAIERQFRTSGSLFPRAWRAGSSSEH